MRAEPRLSICEFTTMGASFDEDLAAYRAAGVAGIGVCEFKILGDEEAPARLRDSGLSATHCIPAVPSILPLPSMPGPDDPAERVEALCASVRRLAELDPDCIVFLTGPGSDRRRLVLEALGEIAAVAERAGVRVALEPIHPSQADELSFVHTIGDAVSLLAEAGAPSVGILVDTWHVWDSPGRDEEIRTHAGRILGVHVGDRREPTRSGFDRVLPGDGVIDLGPLLRTLDEAGYEGWHDIEIFSDDGTFGEQFPDSLWALEPEELVRRARDSFLRVWALR
ncbi:MAG: sugar phosphate isomerase/epimerase family protein [Gaiellaceae bacterium]